MRGVLPETLGGRTACDSAAPTVRVVGYPWRWASCSGAGETGALLIDAGSGRLDCLGKGMTAGTLRVEGPAGHYAGQDLRGGELIITGDAGDCAANGMRGGLLHIAGNAGNWLGAALIGDRAGMAAASAQGGRAGERLGDACGAAGSGCAARQAQPAVSAAAGPGGRRGMRRPPAPACGEAV